MSNPFFDHPILNSPYAIPARHWELDQQGQPTQRVLDGRRRAEFITPIPKPKKRKRRPETRGRRSGRRHQPPQFLEPVLNEDKLRRYTRRHDGQPWPRTGAPLLRCNSREVI